METQTRVGPIVYPSFVPTKTRKKREKLSRALGTPVENGLTKISLITLDSASESDTLQIDVDTDLETDLLEKRITEHIDELSAQERSAGQRYRRPWSALCHQHQKCLLKTRPTMSRLPRMGPGKFGG